MKEMTAIELLKADHETARGLFEKYKAGGGKKADLAKKICLELTVHMMIEEEIFYPACEGIVDKEKLDEGLVEHDSAKHMMTELESGTPADEFYDAKVEVLGEEVKHHMDEEEEPGGIFAQMKKSDVDLKALGAQMAARKADLQKEFERQGLPKPQPTTMSAPRVQPDASRLRI